MFIKNQKKYNKNWNCGDNLIILWMNDNGFSFDSQMKIREMTWDYLHGITNKSRIIMKRLILLSMFAVLSLAGYSQTTTTKVYISTNPLAKKYHKTKSCISLTNDQTTLKYVTLAEAKRMGRTECKNCYGEKVSNPTNVFVCTGGSSKKYHGLKECRGLSSCHGSIVKMTAAKAREAGKTACKLCIK